jgi:hypothetical protein
MANEFPSNCQRVGGAKSAGSVSSGCAQSPTAQATGRPRQSRILCLGARSLPGALAQRQHVRVDDRPFGLESGAHRGNGDRGVHLAMDQQHLSRQYQRPLRLLHNMSKKESRMSYCPRSIIAGGLLAAAAFAWPLAASANPYFAQQNLSSAAQQNLSSAGAGLDETGHSFRACGEQPSCLRVQYQQPYGQQPYQQQPYQPYPQQQYQPNTQPSYQQSSRRFDRPMMEGAIVDTCVAWAYNCGQGGADQFCRQQGYRTALSWDRFYPGRTYVIGSQRICEGNNCGGFSYVVCGN